MRLLEDLLVVEIADLVQEFVLLAVGQVGLG
jgi:hypothetical protein